MFADYGAHGWALCPIARGSKGPRTPGWQRAENAVREPAKAARMGGAGLLHAWSGTCALDVDDLEGAEAWLANHGVDLLELLANDEAVQIRSGRPNRAKLVYRLPAGCTPLPTHKIEAAGSVLLELRCASADGLSVQDVLPPTIHPDTGKPYEWAGAGDWRNLPELPTELLALWRGLQAAPAAAGTAPAPGDAIGPGQRNDVLFKIACKLRGNGLAEATILAALQSENRTRCTPPLTDEELRMIARSASRYEAGQPDDTPSATRAHRAAPPTQLQAVRGSTFVRMFDPPDPILDAIPATGRGRVISITGLTGHGKTTLAAALQVHIANGIPFAGCDCPRGRVLVLCGENPDDYNVHLIATMQQHGLESVDLDDILVVPSRFAIDHECARLAELVEKFGPLTAVFVDTSAAFFFGNDDNDNVDQYEHASKLRSLTKLPGHPTVFVLCHPTKGAHKDALVPRGGGAFLNEIDGNLTLWKDEAGIMTLHWVGKMRGPNFDPIRFELQGVKLTDYPDAKGRPTPSVVAKYLPDDRAEQIHAKELDDEDRLLDAMQRKPDASVRDLAMACGWTSDTGKANATRADRRLKTLHVRGLAEQDRKGRWHLTNKGQKEAESVR